jgi:multiple sugar transport system substrate-binding protein
LFFLSFVLLTCTSADSAQKTLKFWGLGHEGEVVSQLMPEFERRTGIHVDVQQIPWTAAHEKLLTGFVGNGSPDIAQMGNTWIPEFVAIHAIENLTPRLASSSIRRESYFPGIWATNEVGDQLYGVPWYVDTRVLFYRTDLLASAGVARAPRTWSEWVDAMQKLEARGEARFAILLPTNQWEELTILAMQNGATLLRDGDRLGAFEQPDFRQAFHFYVDLFNKGYAPKVSSTQIANVYQGFEQGDFAMYMTGPWNVGEFRNRLSPAMNGKWATTPLPAPDGKPWPGVSMAGGSSLVIFRDSNKKDAAWKLIEFLSEPEQQKKFYELTRDLPAHRAAWGAHGLADDPQVVSFLQQLERVQPLPRVPEWEQIATRIYEHAEAAVRGRITVEQAAADLDRKTDAILAKRRWVLAREAR